MSEPSAKPKDEVHKRANIVGKTPLSYNKWDTMEYESDEDDCHPNIEIGTWRRLKEKMRREKGIKKKEPILIDKWNKTTTNERYHIDPAKPPKTSEEQDQKISEEAPKTAPQSTADATADTESKKSEATAEKTDVPPTTTTSTTEERKDATTVAKSSEKSTTKAQTKAPADDDDEPYKARSNPQSFLDENLDRLRKFAQIKNDRKADKFVVKNPELVHEASEGFLITHAVDRAVEGADKPELARLSRRCLMIHNLVQSCSQQNVAPRIGVERFYMKIGRDAKLTAQYKVELNKQVAELMGRIEERRVERLAELKDIPQEYDEEDMAPLGPGGLDPTEVLNSLPKELATAFIEQDVDTLKTVLGALEPSEAEYHMKRCIDAGLWLQPDDDEDEVQEAEVSNGAVEEQVTQENEAGDKVQEGGDADEATDEVVEKQTVTQENKEL